MILKKLKIFFLLLITNIVITNSFAMQNCSGGSSSQSGSPSIIKNCPMCSKLLINETSTILVCENDCHEFCDECIKKWFFEKNNNFCPVCKSIAPAILGFYAPEKELLSLSNKNISDYDLLRIIRKYPNLEFLDLKGCSRLTNAFIVNISMKVLPFCIIVLPDGKGIVFNGEYFVSCLDILNKLNLNNVKNIPLSALIKHVTENFILPNKHLLFDYKDILNYCYEHNNETIKNIPLDIYLEQSDFYTFIMKDSLLKSIGEFNIRFIFIGPSPDNCLTEEFYYKLCDACKNLEGLFLPPIFPNDIPSYIRISDYFKKKFPKIRILYHQYGYIEKD